MSLRCPCWPKNATSRPPSAWRSAAVAERPSYECASPTLGVHAPGEHELGWYLAVELLDALAQLAQLWLVEQAVGQLEHPFDVGLTRPRPDDPGARLAAQQQVEGVSEHGLAGAGLAGDRREVRAWAQLGPLDQQQVLDPEL